MKKAGALAGLAVVLLGQVGTFAAEGGAFQRKWILVSQTSAVVCWQLDDIRKDALSFVEYGKTEALGQQSELTRTPRWAQFHRLKGLEPGATYRYRMVNADPATQKPTRSEILTFTTAKKEGPIRIPEEVRGPPFILDKPDGSYILTRDVTADGTAFEIAAPNVKLDLDGHTVVFGQSTAEQVSGVQIKSKGKAAVCNGHVVQGARCKEYSTAVESRWRGEPTEIFGISTDVHLRCAYPVKFLGMAADADIHHNLLYSRVTELESRHYPGNDLLRLDISGPNVHVHDNILTEGCHVGIRLSRNEKSPVKAGDKLEVDHNDIRHHMQYTNGYALAAACGFLDIHHNKVTSCGRGVHLTAEGIQLHDNHLDLHGHQELDDMPAKSRPFKLIRVELHGIKFEGASVRNCKVYGNFMRIVQKLPADSDGKGSPDDKTANGVYVRSKATSISADGLADSAQNWEADRWKGYFVKYAPDLPPAQITGNDATKLRGQFQAKTPGEYVIYAKWDYVPATPLNVACYDPNAMNEVYGNEFVGLTEYKKTRHGGYGDSGQWAAGIYFVAMKSGLAEAGRHSIFIHDNRFLSNDVFLGSGEPVNMTVRIEKNRFVLAAEPAPTEGHAPFWKVGAALESAVKAGSNVFEGMNP